MPNIKIEAVIEALLLASEGPVSLSALHSGLYENFGLSQQALLAKLNAMQSSMLNDHHRGVELKEVANGFRLQSKSNVTPWLACWFSEHPRQLSRVLIETLSVIAYHQPVTRGDIEKMRGVRTQNTVVRQLLDRGWVRVTGQKEAPGKQELLGTTKAFLDYFNLKSLSELPKNIEKMNGSTTIKEHCNKAGVSGS